MTRDLVHWNALHEAMLEIFGVDTTIEALPYHVKTDVAILRAALSRCGVSDADFDERLPAALTVVCREVSAHASGILPVVCPAVPEVLFRVHQDDKLLGVASGNLESVGWNKITAAGLRHFFVLGSFGDRCEFRAAIFDHAVRMAREHSGSAATVCFVGDTPDDIRAARSVNAKIIAVSSGSFAFHELQAMNPDLCCHSCVEMLGAVE